MTLANIEMVQSISLSNFMDTYRDVLQHHYTLSDLATEICDYIVEEHSHFSGGSGGPVALTEERMFHYYDDIGDIPSLEKQIRALSELENRKLIIPTGEENWWALHPHLSLPEHQVSVVTHYRLSEKVGKSFPVETLESEEA